MFSAIRVEDSELFVIQAILDKDTAVRSMYVELGTWIGIGYPKRADPVDDVQGRDP